MEPQGGTSQRTEYRSRTHAERPKRHSHTDRPSPERPPRVPVGTGHLQGVDGKWTTAGGGRRGGRCVARKEEASRTESRDFERWTFGRKGYRRERHEAEEEGGGRGWTCGAEFRLFRHDAERKSSRVGKI